MSDLQAAKPLIQTAPDAVAVISRRSALLHAPEHRAVSSGSVALRCGTRQV